MSRTFATVLDWLCSGLFWVGVALALPGSTLAHGAHYAGLWIARRRFG